MASLSRVSGGESVQDWLANIQADRQVIKRWDKPGKSVSLIRRRTGRDRLMYEIIFLGGRTLEGAIDCGGHSIENAIADLILLDPHVAEDDSVYFRRVPVNRIQSLLDSQISIDGDHCAVTLINTYNSSSSSTDAVFGHAAIILERIENGQRLTEKAHLVIDSESREILKSPELLSPNLLKGEVEFNPLPEFRQPNEKTETWLITKSAAQRMIQAIEIDRRRPPFLSFLGRESRLVEPICIQQFESLDTWLNYIREMSPLQRAKLSGHIQWPGRGFVHRFIGHLTRTDANAIPESERSLLHVALDQCPDTVIFEYAMPENCLSWNKKILSEGGIQLIPNGMESIAAVPRLHMRQMFTGGRPTGVINENRAQPEEPPLVFHSPSHLQGQNVLRNLGIAPAPQNRHFQPVAASFLGVTLWQNTLPPVEGEPGGSSCVIL
jgi:hypothetical protein